MPKIQWERLPREKWAHLRRRAKERKISEGDLFQLAEWKAQDPEVPERRLVQGLRHVQTMWLRQVSEHVSDGRTSRTRQAIVTNAIRYGFSPGASLVAYVYPLKESNSVLRLATRVFPRCRAGLLASRRDARPNPRRSGIPAKSRWR